MVSFACILICSASIVGAACLATTVTAQSGLEDPWPFWGRTETRLGNTMTIGPQTARIDWSIQFDFSGFTSIPRASMVLDAMGRLYAGALQGVTAIDIHRRSILWSAFGLDGPAVAPTYADGLLYWGVSSAERFFFCSDGNTGEDVWTLFGEHGFVTSPAVDGDVVYFSNRDAVACARVASSGAAIWERDLNDVDSTVSPALIEGVLVTAGRFSDIAALRTDNGEPLWTFETQRDLDGLPVIVGDRMYLASNDRFLYALDTTTGAEIWRFNCEQLNRGSIALGHDNSVYTATTGNVGLLLAISPDGNEVWRYISPGLISNPPVVGGDGTIYVAVQNASPDRGWVAAINPNGTEKWLIQMPNMCWGSPVLAPDGTLYVCCRDKKIYAFKDPNEVAVLSNFQLAAGTIVSGDSSKLNAADDDYLVIRSRFGFTSFEPNIVEFTVSATPGNQDPRFINIELEGKLDHPNGTTRIWLRNWNTNQFDQIVTYGLSQKEFRGWSYQHDAAAYAHPVSERIDVKVRQSVIVVFSVAGFKSSLDYLEVEVM